MSFIGQISPGNIIREKNRNNRGEMKRWNIVSIIVHILRDIKREKKILIKIVGVPNGFITREINAKNKQHIHRRKKTNSFTKQKKKQSYFCCYGNVTLNALFSPPSAHLSTSSFYACAIVCVNRPKHTIENEERYFDFETNHTKNSSIYSQLIE